MNQRRIWTFATTMVIMVSSNGVPSSLSSSSYEFCLSSNPELEFAITGTLDGPPPSTSSSSSSSSFCCANYICGIPCPEIIPPPASIYGIVMLITVIVSFVVGMLSYFCVNGTSESYFLAGRSFGLSMVSVTLAAASIDSNALLGNADLSYRYHFWDGGKLNIPMFLLYIFFDENEFCI
jgi:hypothetical protein